MKLRMSLFLGALMSLGVADAVRAGDDPWANGWMIKGGISRYAFDPDLPGGLTTHATHPDDQVFLVGTAGDTELSSVEVTLFNVTAEYTMDVTRNLDHGTAWGLAYTLKMPLDQSGRERKQNANDFRPPEQGSFIYTEITDVAPAHEVSALLHYWWKSSGSLVCTLSPGLSLGYWQMSFEEGWERFGQDEKSLASDAGGISVAPLLSIGVGTEAFEAAVSAAYRLTDVSYDSAGLENSSAQGVELGVSAGWHF